MIYSCQCLPDLKWSSGGTDRQGQTHRHPASRRLRKPRRHWFIWLSERNETSPDDHPENLTLDFPPPIHSHPLGLPFPLICPWGHVDGGGDNLGFAGIYFHQLR